MAESSASGAAASFFLELDGLTRIFEGEPAVLDLSLRVRESEIVTLLGPSGCGKTTTLRMVAGFEQPGRGAVRLRGRDITATPPQRRGFGMVFQHYALFPHLTAGENVAFGLEGRPSEEVQDRVSRALELVGLPGAGARRIGSLSGGQQQRVALARALAPEPDVLLLDEPLSNLDAALRERTRRELRSLIKEIGITAIYVTHDQEEAFDLSDRIGVMRAGRLEQVGPAEELYHHPTTDFVATFLGRVGMVEGIAEETVDGIVRVRLAGGVIWEGRRPGTGPTPAGPVRLLVRPEALLFTSGDEGLAGTVTDRRFAGSYYIYRVTVEGGELEIQTDGAAARDGDTVGLTPRSAPEGLFVFPTTAQGE